MRWLPLAVAVAALLMAGCATPNHPTQGADTTATGPPPTTTQTPGPGATYTTSASATATVSATQTSTYPSGPRFAGHHEEEVASHDDFPGLGVSGLLSGGGERVTVEASASNFGGRTYRVTQACLEPWSEEFTGSSGAIAARAPAGACNDTTLRDLPPGQSVPMTASWDGTVYASGSFQPAPPGTYTWTLVFTAYPPGASVATGGTTFRLPFTVTVG